MATRIDGNSTRKCMQAKLANKIHHLLVSPVRGLGSGLALLEPSARVTGSDFHLAMCTAALNQCNTEQVAKSLLTCLSFRCRILINVSITEPLPRHVHWMHKQKSARTVVW